MDKGVYQQEIVIISNKVMENYKDISVNSSLSEDAKVVIANEMSAYIHSRVWEDDALLEGFRYVEIVDIIHETIEKYGDDINKFVAVALEKVAKEHLGI